MPIPELAGRGESDAVGYVRPHEIEVEREPSGERSIPAIVRFANAAGPFVRLEAEREDGSGAVEVVLSRERFDALALRAGERIHLVPRRFRVFPEHDAVPAGAGR